MQGPHATPHTQGHARVAKREYIYPHLAARANPGPNLRQATWDRKTECVQQNRSSIRTNAMGKRQPFQFTNDSPTPATSSSAQGCTMSRAARPTTWPKGYVAGVPVTLTVWCSSHWSRSGPSSKPHTGCSRALQESRNGKASQLQELERENTSPTPHCHGCVRRQSVMKCMTSRCAAWVIKDDRV